MGEPLNSLSLLLIEDNDTFRSLLSEVLTHEGFLVLSVSTAVAAWPLLKESQFDVVICDLWLETEQNHDFVEQSRFYMDLPLPPVILISGAGLTKLKQDELLGRGFRAYLQKPFEIEVLIEKILSVLSQPV